MKLEPCSTLESITVSTVYKELLYQVTLKFEVHHENQGTCSITHSSIQVVYSRLLCI